ncbi:PAP2 family protein [Mucilaginibacter conchicola]|uniref:PAP2 family protein n=1 Tax=Mucilaginibacter conchicola TaxID=2303333 RepID=A0A372P0D4_9SPHI|nr:phosphatase PAP2 family protein [Mucilaginibacter conchicola]RFZ95584.1 PAP2 family protein [Mucilaginibacter conchicola]
MRKFRNAFVLVICVFSSIGAGAQNLDIRLLQQFNGPPSGADGFWKGVSKSDYIVVFGAPVAMLATGFATNDKELKIKALETGGAVLLAEGATVLLKNVVHRDRPYIAHPELFYGKSNATDYSFPSGHTSTAFATATSLSLSFPKWYVIAPSFAYASAVGYSRMYLGVHYPSDVLGGALVGAGSAFLTFKLNKWLHKQVH